MNCFQFLMELLVNGPNIGLAPLTLRKRGWARARELQIAQIRGNCEQLLQLEICPRLRSRCQLALPGILASCEKPLERVHRRCGNLRNSLEDRWFNTFCLWPFHTNHCKAPEKLKGNPPTREFSRHILAHHFLRADFPVARVVQCSGGAVTGGGCARR